jgi:hypothetical protein
MVLLVVWLVVAGVVMLTSASVRWFFTSWPNFGRPHATVDPLEAVQPPGSI